MPVWDAGLCVGVAPAERETHEQTPTRRHHQSPLHSATAGGPERQPVTRPRTRYSRCASAAIAANTSRNVRGMMPCSAGSSLPVMVCVLPLPVWPYAKMVPLKPASTLRRMGAATWSYRVGCAVSCPYTCVGGRYTCLMHVNLRHTLSKVNVRRVVEGSSWLGSSTSSRPSAPTSTMLARPLLCSLSFIGRHRTTTLTHSVLASGGIRDAADECVDDASRATQCNGDALARWYL